MAEEQESASERDEYSDTQIGDQMKIETLTEIQIRVMIIE